MIYRNQFRSRPRPSDFMAVDHQQVGIRSHHWYSRMQALVLDYTILRSTIPQQAVTYS